MVKRIAYLSLILPIFLLSSLTVNAATFLDVEEGSFYNEAVYNLTEMGIIQGYESGYFGPGDTLTRSQLATLLNRYDEKIANDKEEIRSFKGQFAAFKTEKFSNNWIHLADGVKYSPFYKEGCGWYYVLHINLNAPNLVVKPITGEEIDVDGTNYLVYDSIPDMVDMNGAFLGINAGFFSNDQTYGNPEETFFLDNEKRNFRPDRAAISISSFEHQAYIGVWDEEYKVPYQKNVVGGGPMIVKDGVFDFDPYDEAFSDFVKDERLNYKNARTAVGIRNNGSELVIIIAEESKYSEGMDARDLGEIFVDFGVDRAMMFDGGSSSTFVVEDDIINIPSVGVTINVVTGLGVYINE